MDLQIRGLYSQRYTANTWRYLQRASSEVHLLYSTQFQFTTDTRNNWHMWMGWASCSRRTEPGQKRGTQQWNCLNVIASNFYFQQSSKTTVNSHRVVIRFRTKKSPDKRTCLSSRWYGCAILVGLADIVLVPFPTAVCIRVIALPRAIFCLDGVDWVSDLAV